MPSASVGSPTCSCQLEKAALLTQRNVDEAARTTGIGTRTLLRWLKLPEFQAAYREAQREAFGQSNRRFAKGIQRRQASTRVRAAESILTHSAKAIEIDDIEARVSALEQAASSGGPRR
jgi:hypothetical protein